MAWQIQQVHFDFRNTGWLNTRDPFTRNATERFWVNSAGKCMKAVEDQANFGMTGAAHHLPRLTMIIDVPTPS